MPFSGSHAIHFTFHLWLLIHSVFSQSQPSYQHVMTDVRATGTAASSRGFVRTAKPLSVKLRQAFPHLVWACARCCDSVWIHLTVSPFCYRLKYVFLFWKLLSMCTNWVFFSVLWSAFVLLLESWIQIFYVFTYIWYIITYIRYESGAISIKNRQTRQHICSYRTTGQLIVPSFMSTDYKCWFFL